MPKDRRGEKHSADVIGAAVKVMRIAAGEEPAEIAEAFKNAATELVAGLIHAAEDPPKKRVPHQQKLS